MADIDFDFIDTLGKGAFGEVYKVINRSNGGTYALKVVDIPAARYNIQNIIGEVKFLESVDHPNIVKFYKAFRIEENKLGLQMELCEMGDMDKLIVQRKERRFKNQTLHKWMLELSSAVGYLHARSIMHRDLKPGNVFLDKEMSIKLGDFGIAKNVLNSFAGTQIGTSIFMAPETLTGCYYLEADVYSMGCVYLCMATVKELPKSSTGKHHDLPRRLEYGQVKNEVIKACLQADKVNRPTAAQVYQKLLQDDYETLCFNNVYSRTVSVVDNSFTAYRSVSDNEGGILFSNRPLLPGEKFSLTFEAVVPYGERLLAFGFTACNPQSMSGNCPNSVRQLMRFNGCYYERRRAMDMQVGQKLTFWYESNGKFLYKYYEHPGISDVVVNPNQPLWAFFKLDGSVLRVQLVDYE